MTWRGKGSARFQLGGNERARRAMAAGVSNRQSNDTTERVFFNARGQVVGKVLGGWLTKRVNTSRHQLLKPPAWCIDREHLDRLEAIGATGVLLIDEHGSEWRATVADFRRYGLAINRGHGVQMALPLARWRKAVASQLNLFGAEVA
jgi:hypothetical protein